MKKLIFIICLLLFSFNMCGQQYNKEIYLDYGTWSIPHGNNLIAVRAYVTREVFYEKQSNYYRYELILESKSRYSGYLTKTWLYNARVFINGVEVTRDQFPQGFIASIGVEPTMIYWYKTPINTNIRFYIEWKDAIYEPRIRQ